MPVGSKLSPLSPLLSPLLYSFLDAPSGHALCAGFDPMAPLYAVASGRFRFSSLRLTFHWLAVLWIVTEGGTGRSLKDSAASSAVKVAHAQSMRTPLLPILIPLLTLKGWTVATYGDTFLRLFEVSPPYLVPYLHYYMKIKPGLSCISLSLCVCRPGV